MKIEKVSIIIPIYNEEKTLLEILGKVEKVDLGELKKEIILIDDYSKDNSRDILKTLKDSGKYKIIFHDRNRGKGAALQSGFREAAGDIIMIQDADLEYNPNDYLKVLQPILSDRADVCYGSRMTGNNPVGYWYYYLGNYIISLVTRLLYGCKITDVETCYKFFKRDILDKINIKAASFDFEAEFSAKILKNKFRYAEVPISYDPRSFSEGKKISWKDGVRAIWVLVKYKFFN